MKVHFIGFLRSVCIFWPEVSSSETKPTWNNFPACQRCRLLWKSGLLFLVFPLPRAGFRSCYVVRPERFALEWLGFTDLRERRNGEDRLGQASSWRWALKSPPRWGPLFLASLFFSPCRPPFLLLGAQEIVAAVGGGGGDLGTTGTWCTHRSPHNGYTHGVQVSTLCVHSMQVPSLRVHGAQVPSLCVQGTQVPTLYMVRRSPHCGYTVRRSPQCVYTVHRSLLCAHSTFTNSSSVAPENSGTFKFGSDFFVSFGYSASLPSSGWCP